MKTIRSRQRILGIAEPIVMGILNVTPDSFFAESRKNSVQEILDTAGKMLEQGAQILDIGGQSTRPGAERVSEAEEIDRILPALEVLRKEFNSCWLSIDTFYSNVAAVAIRQGIDMVNDIAAGEESWDMFELIAQHKIAFIAMHKKGNPQTMQHNPDYINVTTEVLQYFVNKKKELEKHEIMDWIVDVGFGFGKSTEHNFTLLKNLGTYKMLDRPILAGISRKGMIWKTLNTTPQHALNGTTAAHMLALQNGADLLRVHDVREAKECIQIYLAHQNAQ